MQLKERRTSGVWRPFNTGATPGLKPGLLTHNPLEIAVLVVLIPGERQPIQVIANRLNRTT